MNMNENLNNICRCGHIEKGHSWSNAVRSHLDVCVHNYAGDKNCTCRKYKPDNLKYLEKLYDSRHS